MSISKHDIFAKKVPHVEIDIPEWGGAFEVRALTGRNRMELLDVLTANERAAEEYEADQKLDDEDRKGLAKVERFDGARIEIIWSLYKGDERFFDIEDHDRLFDLDYTTLNAIYAKIVTLRTIPDFAALKKTLSEILTDDSSSD